MRKFKEDDLQMATANLLDLKKLLWCHVANERKTSFQAGARLKKKGVKSGVPDCLIFEPRGYYVGLAIELKIKPNETTDNQIKWLTELSLKNWHCVVCYNIDEVIKVLDEYLNNKTKTHNLIKEICRQIK